MNTQPGHCYIVLFSNGFVKGGKSRDALKRYKAHKATAAALGLSVTGAFYTQPHEDYHANEKRLLLALAESSQHRVGEFFRGVDETTAVEALNSLGHGLNIIREFYGERWFIAGQEAFEALAKDRELWGQPTAVLHFLLGKLDFENHILIQQIEIASALNLPKTRVSEAIKKLVDKGVILKGPKVGRTASYKLNINYGWKGKVVDFQKEQRKKFRVISSETEDLKNPE